MPPCVSRRSDGSAESLRMQPAHQFTVLLLIRRAGEFWTGGSALVERPLWVELGRTIRSAREATLRHSHTKGRLPESCHEFTARDPVQRRQVEFRAGRDKRACRAPLGELITTLVQLLEKLGARWWSSPAGDQRRCHDAQCCRVKANHRTRPGGNCHRRAAWCRRDRQARETLLISRAGWSTS